jgi:hypothetical protein
VIPRADSRPGRVMAALAVMLMALLVVQAPVGMVDRLLHATGHGHVANAFAGALIELPDQDHHDDHHAPDAPAFDHAAGDDHDAGSSQRVADDTPDAPATPDPHHHHHYHQDSPYGPAGGLSLPLAQSSQAAPFGLDDDLRHGIDGVGRDRPPKARLAHVA